MLNYNTNVILLFFAVKMMGDEFPLGSLSFSVDMEDLGNFQLSNSHSKVFCILFFLVLAISYDI